MRAVWYVICTFLLGGLAFSQEFAKGEVYGGYSYVNVDTNGLSDRVNANGWEAGGVANVSKYFGIEGNVAGYYHTVNVVGTDVNTSAYSYTGGPHFHFKPLFIHALFGGDHLTGSAGGSSASQNGFAMALGGGVEIPAANGFGIRGSVDYALSHHNVVGGTRVDQNNVRIGVGLFYAFGARRNHDNRDSVNAPSNTSSDNRTEMIPQLGVSGNRTAHGFWITNLAPNSVLAGTGITENDLIIAIDGKPVASATEIKSLLPPSGEVTLTALVARTARKDVKVTLSGK